MTYFLFDKNTIFLKNGMFLNIGDTETRLFSRTGVLVDRVPNSVLKKELESKGILPLKNDPIWKYVHEDLLLKIANS